MKPEKNKIKEESKKKSKEPKNARRWTDVELDAYADAENSFAATLDKLALKKSSSNEVFEHIQKELAAEMETEDFHSRNNDYFKSTPTKLDISIEKLQQKYEWFKVELTNKTNRPKNGSGLDPEKEPHWYQILNSAFAEMHKPLNLVSSAAETSLVNEHFSNSSLEKHDNDDDDESEPQVSVDLMPPILMTLMLKTNRLTMMHLEEFIKMLGKLINLHCERNLK